MKNNIVGWFEIPVMDMDRAVKFYEAVFNIKLSRNPMGALDMSWFPSANGHGASGSLVHHEYYQPSADGVLIYFNCPSGDLSNELSRVELAGGKVLIPKRLISDEVGHMAVLKDTEGNRIALHSQ